MKCYINIKLLLSLLFITLSCCAYAESENVYLHLKTGETIAFSICDKPHFTNVNGLLKFSSDVLSVEFPIEDVEKVSFNDGTSNNEENDPSEHYASNIMSLSGFKTGTIVSVYSVDGKLFDNFTITSDNSFNVNISDYPKGVYVIKTESLTYKINKR